MGKKIAPFPQAAVAGIEPASRRLTVAHPYQHEYHRMIDFLFSHPAFCGVRVTGFEPVISCFQNTRVSQTSPHPVEIKSAQRESNPHFRHGKTVGCRYIMGADWCFYFQNYKRASGGSRTHVVALHAMSFQLRRPRPVLFEFQNEVGGTRTPT